MCKWILLLGLLGLTSAEYLSLGGNGWTATSANKTIKVKANVPGSIYSDLRREKVLGNIYANKNDVDYRWVAYDNWTYEYTFDVKSDLLAHEKVNLLAEGIDTVSAITINDIAVGKTDNQFVRYVFDVKKVLKVGQNKIKLEFQSAPTYAKTQWEDFKSKYDYDVVPDCPAKEYHGTCHWNFIRKMASSFSWDWGPSVPTQGIWKPIGIEAYDKALIRDLTVVTASAKPQEKNTWTLTVNAFLETAADKSFDAVFDIKLDDKELVAKRKESLKPLSDGTVKVVFEIPLTSYEILAWYPNGVFNSSQKLYKLDVSVSFPDSTQVQTKSKKIGFRTIELVQEPVKPEGLTFYFKVNGLPFYAKGTNWIPAHTLMEDLSPEYIRELLLTAKHSNMNFMRVWGGGIYESDLFYELADEFGIMIWQDFMFACALYPANPEFLKTADVEVQQQVRRLQPHPSIAIWSGNNENEGWVYLGHKENHTVYKKDYYELYINHVMKGIFAEDKTRPFVGSSPSNGKEDGEKEQWMSNHSGDQRYGDVHYYSYDKQLWDWTIYPSGKFASEYGYTSYSSVETYLQSLNESALTVPISELMEWRQHHPGGTNSMNKIIGYYFKLPSNGGVDRFSDLIYLSQITQAMAMKTETEFYRRNREVDSKTGKGYTMGALYWQINDIWQTSSWASVEFGGKWKALQSYAIDFFDNLLVTPYEDRDHSLKVAIVRDDYSGENVHNLTIKVYKWSENAPIHEITKEVKSDSFSAKLVYNKPIDELIKEAKCADRTECVLSVQLHQGLDVEAENFMLLAEPKNSKLVKPNLKVSKISKVPGLVEGKHVYSVTITSEAISPFVLLDFKVGSGLRGQFIENGFFVFDGRKTISLVSDLEISEQQIKDNLVVKTVTDVV